MKQGINDTLKHLLVEFTRESRLYSSQTAKDAYMALVKIITKHLRDDGYIHLPGVGKFKVTRHVQKIRGLWQGDMGDKLVTRVGFKTSEKLANNIKLKAD